MLIHEPKLFQETKLENIPITDQNTREICNILRTFEPTSLEEMKWTRLLKRVDTKYLFHESLLPEILRSLSKDYYALEVDGVRLQRYKTRYYDTPDFELYRQHHNGQRDRFKLRVRSYLNSEAEFLEVKRKDNRGCTQKSRLLSDELPSGHSPEVRSFLEAAFPFNYEAYVPKIANSFYRLALVSKHDQERLSIDMDLRFLSPSMQFALSGVVIAEVKQPRFSVHSAFIQQMRQAGRRPVSFSKYCVGIALAYPYIKRNEFKPLLIDIQRLILGGLN
jgi:hypothetical protein